MGVEVEALFTSAPGLASPWEVKEVNLDTARRRIDFEIGCQGKTLACPACGALAKPGRLEHDADGCHVLAAARRSRARGHGGTTTLGKRARTCLSG